jgi:hypothetical protein
VRFNKPGRETEVAVDEEKEDENTNHDIVCDLEKFVILISALTLITQFFE